MTKIIGVRFRNVGKIYYFSPKDFDIKGGDHVIVETARGVEYGTVVLAPREVDDSKVVQPLKDVIRMATAEDQEREASNRKKEREAYKVCLEKIREHELDMKLIDAEYTFDNNKVLFYFTADGRIDFRELVKDLAAVFKTRIELRQIGVRDETKILGGMGICGRPLCCHTYLSEFAPVSIKMAKEQNLSLNPTKISGTCGRLMCCLKNEQETYEYLNKKMPNVGDTAFTPDGHRGDVQHVNVLRQLVKVLVEIDNDEKEIQEFKVEDITFQPKQKKGQQKKESEKTTADTGKTQDSEAAHSDNHGENPREIKNDGQQEKKNDRQGHSNGGRSNDRPVQKHHQDKSGGRLSGKPTHNRHSGEKADSEHANADNAQNYRKKNDRPKQRKRKPNESHDTSQ